MTQFIVPRRNDWTLRWTEFMKDAIDVASDQVLDWDSEGITCTSWCGDSIEVLTGVNPFDEYVGSFDTMLGAYKVIRDRGFNTLDDLIASMFKEVPVSMAQTGDLVLIQATEPTAVMPHGLALVDPPLYWAVSEQGLIKGDLYAFGVRAFAVGRTV